MNKVTNLKVSSLIQNFGILAAFTLAFSACTQNARFGVTGSPMGSDPNNPQGSGSANPNDPSNPSNPGGNPHTGGGDDGEGDDGDENPIDEGTPKPVNAGNSTVSGQNLCSNHASTSIVKSNLLKASQSGVSVAIYKVDHKTGAIVGEPVKLLDSADQRKASWTELVNKRSLTLNVSALPNDIYTLNVCDPAFGASCGRGKDTLGKIAPFASNYFFRTDKGKIVHESASLSSALNAVKLDRPGIKVLYASQGMEGCEGTYDPLIVDLQNRGGIELSSPLDGVLFNIDRDASLEKISWPVDGASSMFLALDRNGNQRIDDIQELFGNDTIGPDGRRAADGFAALAKYDLNRDRIIDNKDPVFADLRLWSDLNRDGRTDAGELFTLKSKHLKAIKLDKVERIFEADQFGNQFRRKSHVELDNGELLNVFNVWFRPVW